MDATRIAVEIIGWAGMLLILVSYILLSLGKVAGRSRTYQWMNVAGAAGFIVNSGYNGAIPSATLNVIWVAIGLLTLWSIARRPPAAPPTR